MTREQASQGRGWAIGLGIAGASLAGVGLGVLGVKIVEATRGQRRMQAGQPQLAPNFIINKPVAECFTFFQDHLDAFIGAPAQITRQVKDESVAFLVGGVSAIVSFAHAPKRSTRVTIDTYAPGAREALRRFKALVEAGEIPTTRGQSEGPRTIAGHAARSLEQ